MHGTPQLQDRLQLWRRRLIASPAARQRSAAEQRATAMPRPAISAGAASSFCNSRPAIPAGAAISFCNLRPAIPAGAVSSFCNSRSAIPAGAAISFCNSLPLRLHHNRGQSNRPRAFKPGQIVLAMLAMPMRLQRGPRHSSGPRNRLPRGPNRRLCHRRGRAPFNRSAAAAIAAGPAIAACHAIRGPPQLRLPPQSQPARRFGRPRSAPRTRKSAGRARR